jgi:2-methylcitrate dehydratase PrpD
LSIQSGEPPGPRWYTTGRFRDPDIQELASRIRFVFDPGSEQLAQGGKRITTATIVTRDGENRTAHVEYPKGRPENPMTYAELEDKFRANASAVLGPERTESVLGLLRCLETLESISSLTDLLHGSRESKPSQ